jgi:hypothetical protein
VTIVRPKLKGILSLILFSSVALGSTRVPDFKRTPGHLCRPSDPEYVERRYKERIPYCRRAVPPEVIETVYRAYRIPEKKWADYTIDHLIPLALGGSNLRTNLWPEPKEVKSLRYNLEYELYLKLKDGTLTHSAAVRRVLQAKFNPPASALE